jgi:glutathione S-transferase
LSELVGEAPWLAGSALSLADLHAAAMIVVFRLAPEASRLLTTHDRLAKWWDRVSLRPSFLRTQTPPPTAASRIECCGANPSHREGAEFEREVAGPSTWR